MIQGRIFFTAVALLFAIFAEGFAETNTPTKTSFYVGGLINKPVMSQYSRKLDYINPYFYNKQEFMFGPGFEGRLYYSLNQNLRMGIGFAWMYFDDGFTSYQDYLTYQAEARSYHFLMEYASYRRNRLELSTNFSLGYYDVFGKQVFELSETGYDLVEKFARGGYRTDGAGFTVSFAVVLHTFKHLAFRTEFGYRANFIKEYDYNQGKRFDTVKPDFGGPFIGVGIQFSTKITDAKSDTGP